MSEVGARPPSHGEQRTVTPAPPERRPRWVLWVALATLAGTLAVAVWVQRRGPNAAPGPSPGPSAPSSAAGPVSLADRHGAPLAAASPSPAPRPQASDRSPQTATSPDRPTASPGRPERASRSVGGPPPAEGAGRGLDAGPDAVPDADPSAGTEDVEPMVFSADAPGIKAAISEATPEIRRCYDAWLRLQPELQGTLKVSFRIDRAPDSDEDFRRVLEAKVAGSELEHPFLEGCLLSVLSQLRFEGAGEEPLRVTYPFRFSSRPDETPEPSPR